MDVQWLGHENRYYFFGGKDESSYTLIQGITLAGVLLDEAALMPQSFVDQAVARCSVTDSRLWFNCNPDGSEEHWFFQNWVGGEAASGKNRLHLHFTMEDNYALSDAVRQRYERMYTGVFYERYILGLWRMAEGLVYPMFDRSRHVVPDCMPPAGTGTFWVSCDYGTRNPTSIGLLYLTSNGNATRLREYYYDGRKQNPRTDEEHYTALEQLVGTLSICAGSHY